MPELVRSPVAATVVDLPAPVGATVAPGDTVAVVDVMKMEHRILAAAPGRVTEHLVAVGDLVATDQPVVALDPLTGGSGAGTTPEPTAVDLDALPPLVEEVRAAEERTSDRARPEAVAKRRSRGQRTARENVADLCDDGSFVEYGRLAVAARRNEMALDDLRNETPGDGIVTGVGTVAGRPVAVLAVDATVIAGTQGYWHHHKIDRLLDIAHRDRIPVVFFPEGGGGRPSDPDAAAVFTAGLHITSFSAFARLSGHVPLVAIVSGRCFAGSAAFAGCADVVVATAGANLGMAGPAMIEGAGMGTYAPDEIGPMSVQAPAGTVDVVVADEAEAVSVARRYLAYLDGAQVGADEPADQRRLRQLLPDNRREAYEMRPVIDALADPGSVLELRREFGPAAITALARIDGHAVGLAASDPMHRAGAIGPDEADKLARFYQLCDSHGLPVVALCDTPGFMVGPETEAAAHVRHVSRLFVAGAALTVPIFGVIVRKAYGLGAMALLGGHLHAPRLTVAWPTGEIGGMGFEGAVNLGMKRRLDEIADPDRRKEAFDAAVARLYERGRALTSAAHLEFDAVIDPADTRRCLAGALGAAAPFDRSGRFVDPW